MNTKYTETNTKILQYMDFVWSIQILC